METLTVLEKTTETVKPYFYVDVAVIRPDFHYIKFRAVYVTRDKEAASKYYVWMQQFFKCHCYLRLAEGDNSLAEQELNRPENCSYQIPQMRQAS